MPPACCRLAATCLPCGCARRRYRKSMGRFLGRAFEHAEGVESLQVFGLARILYAVVWLCYRRAEELAHPDQSPHLMGHPTFEFSHNRLLMHVHAASSALLLPLVAAQTFGSKGSAAHKGAGRLVAVVVLAAAPFNVALLCQNRYAWWLTTLVETLVLTQWLYHLAKLSATTGALHRWHGVQFVRMWLTPVDVRVVTALALTLGARDPVVATVAGHVGALLLWVARLSPKPQPAAAPLKIPCQEAPRLGGFDLEELPVYRVFVLSLAHLLAGSTADLDDVRMLAHGRPKTLLSILIGGIAALLGGLRLLGLWAEGFLGDWDWTGMLYVLPLMAVILAFSDLYYEGDPLARMALPIVVMLSISPPMAAEGLLDLVRDIRHAVQS